MERLDVVIKPALVVILFLVGLYGALWLKSSVSLSEASFMVLVTLSAIFSTLLPNLNQLKSFSIARGELILQEVKDSEEAVRELAIAVLDVVETSTEYSIVTEEFDEGHYDKAVERVRLLTNKK